MESEEYLQYKLDSIESNTRWFIGNYKDEPMKATAQLTRAKHIASTTIEQLGGTDTDLEPEQIKTLGKDVVSQLNYATAIISGDVNSADEFDKGFLLRGTLEQVLSGIDELREYKDEE